MIFVDESFKTILFEKGDDVKIEGFEAAVTGALAGLVAQGLVTPLDVARTRIILRDVNLTIVLNNADISQNYDSNPFSAMTKIAQDEGILALSAGIIPRSVRALGSGAIQFASYEISQNMLNQ